MLIELIGTVGETYIDICECDGDEHELLITATDLMCPDCGGHQPHYTDEMVS
jgi:Zn finger protein HypA/HybF involved in hydrogenase expression